MEESHVVLTYLLSFCFIAASIPFDFSSLVNIYKYLFIQNVCQQFLRFFYHLMLLKVFFHLHVYQLYFKTEHVLVENMLISVVVSIVVSDVQ